MIIIARRARSVFQFPKTILDDGETVLAAYQKVIRFSNSASNNCENIGHGRRSARRNASFFKPGGGVYPPPQSALLGTDIFATATSGTWNGGSRNER